MQRTSLHLSTRVLETIRQRAAKNGITAAALIRLLIERSLDSEMTLAK